MIMSCKRRERPEVLEMLRDAIAETPSGSHSFCESGDKKEIDDSPSRIHPTLATTVQRR